LWKHDIVEILVRAGYVEAQAEFFLFASDHSPFEPKEEKHHRTSESCTPQCSFFGYDKDIDIRILLQCIESD
jgi:hypothetical protein